MVGIGAGIPGEELDKTGKPTTARDIQIRRRGGQ